MCLRAVLEKIAEELFSKIQKKRRMHHLAYALQMISLRLRIAEDNTVYQSEPREKIYVSLREKRGWSLYGYSFP